MRQRTSAQLWGKQGALGALIAGIVAGACCLPAAARAAPASDNFGGNTSCGGSSGHAGICFLPYA